MKISKLELFHVKRKLLESGYCVDRLAGAIVRPDYRSDDSDAYEIIKYYNSNSDLKNCAIELLTQKLEA